MPDETKDPGPRPLTEADLMRLHEEMHFHRAQEHLAKRALSAASETIPRRIAELERRADRLARRATLSAIVTGAVAGVASCLLDAGGVSVALAVVGSGAVAGLIAVRRGVHLIATP